jgi:DNA-binding MarR family transcriptional regulator
VASQKKPLFLTYFLKTLQQALRVEVEQDLRDQRLTLPQLGVLRTLLARPGASNAELARFAFVAPQSMAELLGTLERAGLIRRRADPRNARVLKGTLTAEGERAATRGLEAVARAEAKMVAGLSAQEQRQLRDLLSRCLDALGTPAVREEGEG